MLRSDGYYDSYCKPCSVGITHEWKENNKERSALNYLEYFTNETGFVTGSIASKFKPELLSLLWFLGEFLSYQSAVPGLIGIPVSVIPTTDAI